MTKASEFYGLIDIDAREKNREYDDSDLRKVLPKNKIVMLTKYYEYTKVIIKWHWNNDDQFYNIPDGCYTPLTPETHPEYYL